MPRITSKSPTRRKRPPLLRKSTMAFAVVGPTPGSCSSSFTVAVFRSIGCVGGFFFARESEEKDKITAKAKAAQHKRDAKLHVIRFHSHKAGSRTRAKASLHGGRDAMGVVLRHRTE